MRGYDLQLVSLYTPRKRKTRNVRGIVHIWFLISNKSYLKWALVQSSPTKLIFLCMMGFFTVLENFVDFWGRGVNITIQIKCLPHIFYAVNQLFGGFCPIPNVLFSQVCDVTFSNFHILKYTSRDSFWCNNIILYALLKRLEFILNWYWRWKMQKFATILSFKLLII